MDDWELLQQYVGNGTKPALEELVRRHLSMVYAAALREVADPHLAEDVTQAVFIVLMRRARHISSRAVLAGWLFNTTRFVAADAKKMNARRSHHERKAAAMHAISSTEPDSSSEQIQHMLNDALAAIPQKYRDVIVMTYLQGKTLHEVAIAQRLSETAARQRRFRGIAKLRGYFARKGLTLTEDTLNAQMLGASAETASPLLVGRICAALHSSAPGNAALIAQNTIRRMIMFKMKVTTAAVLTLVLAGITVRIILAQADANSPSQPAAQGTAPVTAPATQSVVDPLATPQEILVLAWRSGLAGDSDKLLNLFPGLTPVQKTKTTQIVAVTAAVQKVADAANKKFGNDIQQSMLDAIGLNISEADFKNGKVTIDGDSAVVDVGSAGPGQIPMVKTPDGWRISPGIIDAFDSRELAGLQKLLPPLHQMAQDIDAGKYADADALKTALGKLLSGPSKSAPAPAAQH